MTPARRAQFLQDLERINFEIERINSMIVERENKPSHMYRNGMIGLGFALLALVAYAPFAHGQTNTIDQFFHTETDCDEKKALFMIGKQRGAMKPLTFVDQHATQVAVLLGQLSPTKQAIMFATVGGKLVILACGPGSNWMPRHYTIDVEAERRFYNLAPEVPQHTKKLERR